MMTYLFNILQDGFFAAIAAIGFASISNPPRQAYKYCALIAALGHATRYVLTHNAYGEMHLIGASFIASLVIGVLTVLSGFTCQMPGGDFLLPRAAPHDSGNVRLPHDRSSFALPDQPGRTCFQPLFLSVVLQRFDLYIYYIGNGRRSHATHLPVQEHFI